jgi:uncharacterized protein (TIRG00374 family)
MSPRQKRLVVLLVKVGVLVCIVEYARRQAQFADALTVQAGGTTVTSTTSRPVELPAGTRLSVDFRTDDDQGKPLIYRTTSKDGTRFDVPASAVQGAPAGAAADSQRPFTVLPGIRTLLSSLRWRWLALGFLLFGPPVFLMAVRWRILLLASGIEIPFLTLVRLHYLGFFFNTFMPGGAGGDIIKAVYVARHCSQKTEAATMVVIDRVIGVLGLLAMAGGVVLVEYRAMRGIAAQVGALSLALFVAFALFFSAKFRRLVRYDTILSRFPRADVFGRIDAALYGLRAKKSAVAAAFALTVALQLIEVIAISFAGRAIGMSKPRFSHYLAFVPIGYLVNALPISFGGIGLMEGAYLTLFRDAGVATATEGFMLGVLGRLLVIGWGLLGALSALFPPERAEMEATPAPSSL